MRALINRIKRLEEQYPEAQEPEALEVYGPANGLEITSYGNDLSRLSLAEYSFLEKWGRYRYRLANCGPTEAVAAIEFKTVLSEAEQTERTTLKSRWFYSSNEQITEEGKDQKLIWIIASDLMYRGVILGEELNQDQLDYREVAKQSLGGCSTENNQELVDWILENNPPPPRRFGRLRLIAYTRFDLLPVETKEFYQLLLDALDRTGYEFAIENRWESYCCGGKDTFDRFLSCIHPLEAAHV